MSVTLNEVCSPTSKADVYKVYGNSSWTDTNNLIIGSTAKANQNQAAWLMFEPPIPAGSTLVSVELNLYCTGLAGLSSVTQDISVGFIDLDGTWNVQTGSTGWDEYAGSVDPGTEPTIHPSRDNTSDTNWVNNFPSFHFTWTVGGSPAPPAAATAFSFADSGGDYDDSAFLTDAQDAFDDNETNRTARGVPMAIHIVPKTNELIQVTLASNENPTTANRPELVIVYDPPSIAAELSGGSSMDADVDMVYGAASELAGDAAVDAAAAVAISAASELAGDAAVDAAAAVAVSAASELAGAAATDANLDLTLNAASELAGAAATDANLDLTLNAASELAGAASLDADVDVAYAVAAELSTTATVDAAAAITGILASELAGAAALDADATLTLGLAAELAGAAAIDANLGFNFELATELADAATLDARLVGRFFLETELAGAAAIDALFRGTDTAANPLEVLYKLAGVEVSYAPENATITNPPENIEVSYKALSAEITNPQANIEVTMPADNIEVGAD